MVKIEMFFDFGLLQQEFEHYGYNDTFEKLRMKLLFVCESDCEEYIIITAGTMVMFLLRKWWLQLNKRKKMRWTTEIFFGMSPE